MGMVTWSPFSASDLTSLPNRPGRYLADMSIFRPEHVRLVEQALLEGPENGSTGKQVWDALDRAVPEHTVHLILGEMAHKGLVERKTTSRRGRGKGTSVFRAL